MNDKRTRRYIFNTLTVVSLLVLLATVGLWWRSYAEPIEWIRTHAVSDSRIKRSRFFWNKGVFYYAAVDTDDFPMLRKNLIEPDILTLLADAMLSNLLWKSNESTTWKFSFYWKVEGIAVSIPLWFVALIFVMLPAIWFIKWRKRKRLTKQGNCPSCGYDLTGNTTGECPECGNSIGTEAAQA